MPATSATHNDPFSHAVFTWSIRRRIADPRSVDPSWSRPCGSEIAVGVSESSTRVEELPTGTCSR